MSTNPVATGESTKLQVRYKGPYSIVEVLPGDTYRIVRLNGSKRAYDTTAHAEQLKLWKNNMYDNEQVVSSATNSESEVDEEGNESKKLSVKVDASKKLLGKRIT